MILLKPSCVICSNVLSGKQEKYCSPKCLRKDKNRLHLAYDKQQEKGRIRKLYFVNLLGGKCQGCGYSKNIAALEFHHRNPIEKDAQLDIRKLSNSKIEWIIKEVEKCDLLCSNCHREHHNPLCDMTIIKDVIVEDPILESIKKASYVCTCGSIVSKKGSTCISCAIKTRWDKHTYKIVDEFTKRKRETKISTCLCGNKMDYRAAQCTSCAKLSSRRANRPSIERLREDLSTMSYVAAGKKYGVSDNAIRKWLK